MLELKTYQRRTIDKLSAYLEQSRLLNDPVQPFAPLREAQGYREAYKPLAGLESIPYVCLRLPTGGGKTLLSAHTAAIAADTCLETDYPLVLWLAPTDAIRKQTLETLRNPLHPNRQVLDEQFDGRVRIFDITEFEQLRSQDIGTAACVFVATFGSFRVNSTDGRKVYAHNENLEPHFSRVTQADWMDKKEDGQVKFSFANLLGFHRPLVIVDEAHNHNTKLSEDVLNRVRAAAVIEYTATPNTVKSNVLYKVSAAELKAEDMIKLPVRLSEYAAWTDAVHGAIQTRARLEVISGAEEEYIRPIVLFQAQDKNEEVTVDLLVKHLVEQEQIPREQIAVATGNVRELEKENLFDRNCNIRFVVTVEALKEGWDCAFAYVFCSVAKVRSGKDAEQLLGRVLRMPYAKRRKQDDLNKAYAHIPVASWTDGLSRIRDNLVSMGFEEQEAEQNVQLELVLPVEEPRFVREDIVVYSVEPPDTSSLNLALQGFANVEQIPDGGYKVTFPVTSREEAKELLDNVQRIFRSSTDQSALVQQLAKTVSVFRPLSPSERGETIVVPQLCLDFGDEDCRAAEKEDFLPDGLDLLQFPVALDAFRVLHEEHVYEIDVQGTHVKERALTVQETLALPAGVTHWDETSLVIWLDRRLQQDDVPQPQMSEFLRRHVHHLTEHRAIPLAELVRLRFLLEKLLREKIAKCREEAYHRGFQRVLFDMPQVVKIEPTVATVFQEGCYPVNSYYKGSFQFTKHFFPMVAAMDSEEETACAKAIDSHPKVQTWVRNLDSQPKAAFWLATSKGKFYPDFVAKLEDGRILVIEYKGAHLIADPATQEKAVVGETWARETDGACLFLMAVKKDEQGRGVWEQLQAVLG